MKKIEFNIINKLWLIFGFLGMIGFFIIWEFMPHKSEIDTIWQMFFKIFIFLLCICSIAFFPNKFKNRFLLLLIPTFIFVGFLIPKIGYYGFVGVPQNGEYGQFYTHLYLLTFPAILMTLTLAYRLGGGTPGKCIKIAFSGVIILFSGFLDYMWYVVSPVEIPQIIPYAHHIKVIIGHYPAFTEAIIFSLFHIPLLIGILILPIDKWLSKNQAFNELSNKETQCAA